MSPPVIHALIALAPVIACLVVFELVDAFRLVSLIEIFSLLAGGAGLATAAYFANGQVTDAFPMAFTDYTRYVAPAIEEALKAILIVALFAFNRVGYLVDAAIAGFAVGSGFALAENMFFLREFAGADTAVWIVRGFGTAIMHGGATAILSAASLALYARRLRVSADRFHFNPLLFLPGLAAAMAIHAGFNHFQHASLVSMAVVLLAVPLGLFLLFSVGETYAHRWLVEDRESHSRLLADMRSGVFAQSVPGRALTALANRLDPAGARDLLDYVRTNVELVVRADVTLLALEEHEHVVLGKPVHEQFAHLHTLERRLGRTIAMAARQHLRFSRDDLWKMHELEIDADRRDMRG